MGYQQISGRVILAILFSLLFPLILTYTYFSWSEGSPVFQKSIYLIGKTVQFAFPLVWLYWLCPRKEKQISENFLTEEKQRHRTSTIWSIFEGLLFGLFVYGIIVGGFYYLQDSEFLSGEFQSLQNDLGNRFEQMGLLSPAIFIGLGIFYTVFHSGLEEYYWRWFVFNRIQPYMPWEKAAVIGSFGFTLHHILILGSFFGSGAFLTGICIFGIFLGGFYWCWLYRRTNRLVGSWLSHALVDAALFTVGYLILFQGNPLP